MGRDSERKDIPERPAVDPKRLFFEQLNLVYAQAPLGVAGSVFVGLAFAYTHIDVIPRAWLAWWFTALLIIAGLRAALLLWRKTSIPVPDDNSRWSRLFMAGVALSAAVWGASFIWLFADGSMAHQTFHIILMAGLAAGAVATYSYVFWNVVIFLFISFTPLLTRLFPRHEDEIYFYMILILLAGLTLVIMAARRLHQTVESSLALMFENEEMAKRLAADMEKRKTTEEMLEDFELEIASILGNMQDSLFRADVDGVITFISPAIGDLTGFSAGALTGAPAKSIYLDPYDYDRLLESVESEGGAVREFEARLVKKDGGGVCVSINAQRYYDRTGRVIGVEGTIRDITERKKYESALAETLREMEAMFAAMPDIYYLFDMDGRLVKWNKKMEMVTGLGPDSLKGRHVLDFVPDEQRQRFAQAFAEVFKRGIHWVEGDMMGAGGGLIPHQFSGVAMRDEMGNFTGLSGIGRDMTRKKDEERALISAKLAAEEATRLKDKFMSLVSHDLRSPIASVIGFLEILARDGDSALDETNRTLMERTIRILHGMLRMIDNLLTISMIQTGKMALRKRLVDARFMVCGVVESVSFIAQNKGLAFHNQIPADMKVYADSGLLSEVLRNLLTNSVKFTNPGGEITVFVPDGKDRALAVRDTGIGINEQALENIFRHDVRTTRPGTAGEIGGGLGLPMCKDIMDAHQGSITVESKEGEGTVFYVELPPIRPAVAVIDGGDAEKRPIKVAVEDLGADLLELESGKVAFDAVKNAQPHIIFMNMVSLTPGWRLLLASIKNDSELSHIHVIALVEAHDNRMKEVVLNMGADAVLNKPAPVEDLKFLIGSHILEMA